VAKAALGDPHAAIVPRGTGGTGQAHLRAAFARSVRAEVGARKRARLEMDYDDLLVRVRDALVDPVIGEPTAARLRSRYSVVLVDEFQDTDPVQWQILRSAFHGHVPLVLIGDPKQAIYAFRGGDLHTYLEASSAATTGHTLAVNWRADPDVVDGVGHLLRGAALGDSRIVVHHVDAGLDGQRVTGPAAPVRLRVITCDDGPCDQSGRLLKVDGARSAVARDAVAVVVDLLGPPHRYGPERQRRRLLPRDVAVLVRTNRQADLIRGELARTGIPAVLSGTRSVFATDAARAWVTLLRALEEPHRAGLVRAAALTIIVGTPPEVFARTEADAVDALGVTMRQWRTA
jgi:exodeoxyribonuclease V beta subunit